MNDMTGATAMITGGTGSFGSTMVAHLLGEGVARINILSRDEAKQDEMRNRLGDSRVKFFVGDVRDYESVAQAVTGADFVFHAAALKQVPSCEFFPDQAVKTNVTGSKNVIEASHRHGVRSVVCLSTDKAVYPVNAMGMTKALMEKTAQAFARNHPESRTTVSITRYGNVMFSRGSVIPLFVRQLRGGQPLTVTEPGMTRFLMSLEDSVALVKHAFFHAVPGDLFVKKAPATDVGTLARAVAQVLNCATPEVRRIGMRHGEKMSETLLTREEVIQADDQDDYFRVPLDARALDYGVYTDHGEFGIPQASDYDSTTTRRLDLDETVELLLSIPELQALARAGARG
jgi:UDP-N-acetylglucosamine 4,6-dehydratase/5-epimerase